MAVPAASGKQLISTARPRTRLGCRGHRDNQGRGVELGIVSSRAHVLDLPWTAVGCLSWRLNARVRVPFSERHHGQDRQFNQA